MPMFIEIWLHNSLENDINTYDDTQQIPTYTIYVHGNNNATQNPKNNKLR